MVVKGLGGSQVGQGEATKDRGTPPPEKPEKEAGVSLFLYKNSDKKCLQRKAVSLVVLHPIDITTKTSMRRILCSVGASFYCV